MIKRILINKSGKVFYLRDLDNDFHTQFGIFKKKELKKKSGSEIKSTKGAKFSVIDASFSDSYRKIKRDAQIISMKDIGIIITNTGINKESFVLDAGSGSGALCCFLAKICKKVVSYELRKDFVKIVNENKKNLGLSNLTVKNKDIYKGISDKNVDVIVLDLPSPWEVIEHANNSLKPGGFLVSYSPSIPQTIDFVNKILSHKGFSHVRTTELIQRDWQIEDRKVRPQSRMMGHTGFLSFCRKI